MRRTLWIVAVALIAVAAGPLGATGATSAPAAFGAQDVPAHDGAHADALAARIEALPTGSPADEGSPTDDQRLLVDGYAAFIASMDAFDGPRAIRLARGMHAHAGAIWSAFCVEGALRRAAPADVDDASIRAFAEADAALAELLTRAELPAADALAVTQRRAILAAGFARHGAERAALGRALSMGGIDGAQISGLAALTGGDDASAARLFGSLLDAGHVPDVLPWPLRGHGIATLELLRGPAAR